MYKAFHLITINLFLFRSFENENPMEKNPI